MFKKLKVCAIMLSMLTISAGCTFCLIYEPIYADYEHDTPETIRQIDRNNLVYDEMCSN